MDDKGAALVVDDPAREGETADELDGADHFGRGDAGEPAGGAVGRGLGTGEVAAEAEQVAFYDAGVELYTEDGEFGCGEGGDAQAGVEKFVPRGGRVVGVEPGGSEGIAAEEQAVGGAADGEAVEVAAPLDHFAVGGGQVFPIGPEEDAAVVGTGNVIPRAVGEAEGATFGVAVDFPDEGVEGKEEALVAVLVKLGDAGAGGDDLLAGAGGEVEDLEAETGEAEGVVGLDADELAPRSTGRRIDDFGHEVLECGAARAARRTPGPRRVSGYAYDGGCVGSRDGFALRGRERTQGGGNGQRYAKDL